MTVVYVFVIINQEIIDVVGLVENITLYIFEKAQVNQLELIVELQIEEKFKCCDKLNIER